MAVTTQKTMFTQDAQGNWWIPKDKNAILDYAIDWSAWLGADTIMTFLPILPAGTELTVVTTSIVGGKVTVAIVSGGTTLNAMQMLTYRIITTGGRTEDRSIYFKISDR